MSGAQRMAAARGYNLSGEEIILEAILSLAFRVALRFQKLAPPGPRGGKASLKSKNICRIR